MTPARLFAIALIFACTTVAWFVLGGTIVQRTGESDARLAQEVARLWGGRHTQKAPTVSVLRPGTTVEQVQDKDEQGRVVTREVRRQIVQPAPVSLDSSRIEVALELDHRRKGLLWYDTYGVSFSGRYRFRNPDPEPRTARVHVAFPSAEGLYDGFVFQVNGHDAPTLGDLSQGSTQNVHLGPGEEAEIELAYRSRGLGEWTYDFGAGGVARVQDFTMTMRTDFDRIDFPAGTISPSTSQREDGGWRLGWRFDSLVTGQKIGMDLPNRLNPGPFASRVTFFAPVSLLFFVTVLVLLGALRGRSLHPVNYFFLAAAFFAFHLLLAYLVDHVDVHVAFAIAAATSVLLVVSYLRLVAGWHYAVAEAGLAQVVFLVLFSYAFFFEGATGLTVTVGAVLTLFVLMQLTGRVDWDAVFAGPAKAASRT